MSENTTENLEYNKMLVSFYSSELNAHGRLIIGFAALIFTVSQIGLSVSQYWYPLSQWQFWLLVAGMLVSSMAFWYVLMRQLVYGVLISTALHTKLDQFEDMYEKIVLACYNTKKIFWFVPVSLFLSADKKGRRKRRVLGLLLCLLLASVTTIMLVLILRMATVEEILSQIV